MRIKEDYRGFLYEHFINDVTLNESRVGIHIEHQHDECSDLGH